MTDKTEDERWERLSRDRVDRPLPKRFYTSVSVSEDRTILLDGRAVKTPLKAKLQLPNAALAAAVAEEWAAQQQVINPATMPLTKLANTAIDRASTERRLIAEEIAAFAANDLLFYRAEAPAALLALQDKQWNTVLAWAASVMKTQFTTTLGVIHVAQTKHTMDAVHELVESYNGFHLIVVHNLTTLTGSAILAFMLAAHAADAEQIWSAAHVDEDFQISQWGEDHEAAQRRANRKLEFDATVKFLSLL